jgi:DnaK suppressor protein
LPDAEQLAQLRRMLERALRERERQVAALKTGPVDVEDNFLFRVHARSAREALLMIRRALGRLEAGTYGRCVHCGAVIPFARLELVPHTDGCVACRRRLDSGR